MQTQGSMGNNGRGNKQNSSYTNNQSHKKVFSKDEGEYVDFEEIKE